MTTSSNGYRGHVLPPSRRVSSGAGSTSQFVSVVRGEASARAASNEAVLASHLSAFGPNELNIVITNQGTKGETNERYADLMDLFDLVSLRTTHGREPSTFAKELMPGIFLAPTRVQHIVGDFGLQTALEQMLEGIPTLASTQLLPADTTQARPMMWLISAGDTRIAEALYSAMDRTFLPHRHMHSHSERDTDTLRWAILAELSLRELDIIFPNLRNQAGFATYLQSSDANRERLQPQTGLRTDQ